MRKVLEIGGFIAAVVLICFGIASIVMGVNARSTVQSTLKQEQIVGTPDMTPAAIKAEAAQAGLPSSIKLPTVAVAGLPINSGDRAHAFASYMRIHALEATGGLTYAQMPRYATSDGKGTNDATLALKGPGGQPMDNSARQIWINETALSTALNTSYMAEQLSLFGIVVGIALLLSGIGFGVLALGGALRNRETPLDFIRRNETSTPAPTAKVLPV
jgi:F0F1-type ATP synthase membrane subunit c/vacuolar-type H+-ATPase subunit K